MRFERDLGAALKEYADSQMVLQVLTDGRQIDAHIDAVLAEFIGGPDARQHQKLR